MLRTWTSLEDRTEIHRKRRYVLIVADFSVSTSFFGAFAADDVTAPVPAATAPNKESKSSITAAIWDLRTSNHQKAYSA